MLNTQSETLVAPTVIAFDWAAYRSPCCTVQALADYIYNCYISFVLPLYTGGS